MRIWVHIPSEALRREVVRSLERSGEHKIALSTGLHPKHATEPVDSPDACKTLLQRFDCVVFDARDESDHELGRQILSTFADVSRRLEEDQQRTFVALSSVLSWGRTPVPPPPLPAAPDRDDPGAAAAAAARNEDEGDDGAVAGDGGDAEPGEPVLVSDDMEWHLKRQPLPEAVALREFERAVVKARKKNVRVFVVTLGALYGGPGLDFYPLFAAAYKLHRLPLVDGGRNTVPTLHVQDAAAIVSKVVNDPPAGRVFLAVDKVQVQLRTFVEALRVRLGDPREPLDESAHDYSSVGASREQHILWQLHLPSKPAVLEAMGLEWHCADGPAAAMDRLVAEFVQAHRLQPVRVVVLGGPFSLHGQVASALATHYHLPLCGEQHGAMMSSAVADRVAACTAVRQTLDGPACRNYGYVLCGFPRDETELRALFGKAAATSSSAADAAADGDGTGAAGPGATDEGDGASPDTKQADASAPEKRQEMSLLPGLLPTDVVVVREPKPKGDGGDTDDEPDRLARERAKAARVREADFEREQQAFRTTTSALVDVLDARGAQIHTLRVGQLVDDAVLQPLRLWMGAPRTLDHPYTAPHFLSSEEIAEAQATAEATAAEQERAARRAALEAFRSEQVRREEAASEALARLSEDEYLQRFVAEPLRQALLSVATVRPPDPLAFIADLLNKAADTCASTGRDDGARRQACDLLSAYVRVDPEYLADLSEPL